MKKPDNVEAVSALSPDYMGFIFFEKSPRCCFGMNPKTVRSLPGNVTPVMVTVDMDPDRLVETAMEYGINVVQLHGKESPAVCKTLKEKGLTVWKAFAIETAESFERMRNYAGIVDKFLFDTPTANSGGSGKKFDWRLISSYSLPVRFMLSGGIAPGDEEEIRNFSHPMLDGIDLNSRFEITPGHKDALQLKEFLEKF